MNLLELYQERIAGVIHGLDRIRLRGTERVLSNKEGFNNVLKWTGIMLKDFAFWAESVTKSIRAQCAPQADHLGIHAEYLKKMPWTRTRLPVR